MNRGDEVELCGRDEVTPPARAARAAEPPRALAEPAAAEHTAEQVFEPTLLIARPTATACATVTEHAAEDVLEPTRLAAVARGEARPGAHRPNLVVLLAHLGVSKNRMGLADLLELRLRFGIARVRIGVVLARELPVLLLQICLGDVLGDAEHGIEVLLEPVLASHGRAPLLAGNEDGDLRSPQQPIAERVPGFDHLGDGIHRDIG